MTFDQWMAAVDVHVGATAFGLSVHDLPDIAFRDLYDAGETPAEAAHAALEAADFPFDALTSDGDTP